MAKFDFRLQALLNVKRQLEKSVKNELGAAIRELENQKAILNEMQLVIASQENEYRKDGVRKIRLSKLKQRLEYIRSMYEKEDLQQQRVNEEIRNVDKIRVHYINFQQSIRCIIYQSHSSASQFLSSCATASGFDVTNLSICSFNSLVSPSSISGRVIFCLSGTTN
jgi:flagellar FliJ protein